MQASLEAYEDYLQDLSDEQRAAAESSANSIVAAIVNRAVEARFEALATAEASMEIVVSAAAELELKLAEAADAGAQAHADISAAWQLYASQIESTLIATQTQGTQALTELFATADSSMADLTTTLAGVQGDIDTVGQAFGNGYAAFFASLSVSAEAQMLATLGYSSAEIDAMVYLAASSAASTNL